MHQFELAKPVKEGSQPERALLEDYEVRTGEPSEKLDAFPLPPEVAYVWAWFLELDRCRGGNGFGVDPLGWMDLQAWARLRRLQLSGFELDCLLMLDQVRLEDLAKKS